MLFLSLFFGQNQINSKRKNNICSLHNDVTPRHLESLLYVKICVTAPEVGGREGGVENREQTTLPSELPRSLPYSCVTHAFISASVSSHQQDLRLTRKIQLLFFPSPLLLSLASRHSKAKEIPESTSSEQEHRLKFSPRFCLCQHCALILGNIRDYRETQSSTSVGRLKNMNGSLQSSPFFLQTCISKLNLSHISPAGHCKQGTYCSKKFTRFPQIFPNGH